MHVTKSRKNSQFHRNISMAALFLFFAMEMTAQTTSSYNSVASSSHTLRVGDQLSKHIVDYTIRQDTLQNVLWDFSAMEAASGRHRVRYSAAYNMENTIAGTENNCRYYYKQAADSIILCGWENNLVKVEYDRPELQLVTPLTYGMRHEGLFHGSMVYCERMFFRIFGSYSAGVDATGSIILPSGDTLRHVSRIHIHRHTIEQHFPHVATEKDLRQYIDSISPYTSDSILRHLTADRNIKETDTYRWYAAGYRYPILEVSAAALPDGQPRTLTAFFFPPEEQEQLDEDPVNEQIRQQIAQETHGVNHGDGGNNESSNTNTNLPFDDISVQVQGSTVIVRYNLTEQVSVKALVCDISGMVYRETSQHGDTNTTNHLTIDCSGLRHGEYVLYLNANGAVHSQNISIK